MSSSRPRFYIFAKIRGKKSDVWGNIEFSTLKSIGSIGAVTTVVRRKVAWKSLESSLLTRKIQETRKIHENNSDHLFWRFFPLCAETALFYCGGMTCGHSICCISRFSASQQYRQQRAVILPQSRTSTIQQWFPNFFTPRTPLADFFLADPHGTLSGEFPFLGEILGEFSPPLTLECSLREENQVSSWVSSGISHNRSWNLLRDSSSRI